MFSRNAFFCVSASEQYEAYLNDLFESILKIAGLILFLALLVIAFFIIVWWRIYKKAGEPGWVALVPGLNSWVMYKITWGKGTVFIAQLLITGALSLLGNIAWIFSIGGVIVSLIYSIVTNVKLAKVFHKSGGFAFGLIVLPFVFLPILAFGSAEYDRSAIE